MKKTTVHINILVLSSLKITLHRTVTMVHLVLCANTSFASHCWSLFQTIKTKLENTEYHHDLFLFCFCLCYLFLRKLHPFFMAFLSLFGSRASVLVSLALARVLVLEPFVCCHRWCQMTDYQYKSKAASKMLSLKLFWKITEKQYNYLHSEGIMIHLFLSPHLFKNLYEIKY